MNDTPDDVFFRTREALERFHAEAGAYTRRHGLLPLIGSPSQVEHRDFPREESIRTLTSQISMLVEIGADQLTAFIKTVSEPFETIAPWTCCRSLIEASALANWLSEPGLEVEARVRRSIALRYEGVDQQRKWARSAGEDPQVASNRLDEIAEMATDLGCPPLLDRNGRRCGAGAPMPSVTDLVRLMLNEEATYRWLSAVAHGHSWAVHQAGFQRIDPIVGDDPSGMGSPHVMIKAIDMQGMVFLSDVSARAFGLALWSQCLYFGWDQDQLSAILTVLFDQLNIPRDQRFWLIG